MKKLITLGGLFLMACSHPGNDGTYVRHFKNEYYITDDTLVIANNIVTERTGYRPIRNGHWKAKKYKVQMWRLNEPMSPVIQIKKDGLLYGQSWYQKI